MAAFPFRSRMRHPIWSASDVNVHAIDGRTALVSDPAQKVRRCGVMVPSENPNRWWVSIAYLLDMPEDATHG